MSGQRSPWSMALMSSPIGFPGKQAVRSRGSVFIKEYSRGSHLWKQDGTEGEVELQGGPYNRLTRPPEDPEASMALQKYWAHMAKPSYTLLHQSLRSGMTLGKGTQLLK